MNSDFPRDRICPRSHDPGERTPRPMLSSTLSDGLAQYRIGAKVRSLRLGKQLNQQQLAQHTGLSTALLSKIERGQLFPTLPTLLRIALVFGVGLEHFFIETDARPLIAVTRREDRVRLPDQPGKTPPAYLFESLDFPVTERKMEAYLCGIPALIGTVGVAPACRHGIHLPSLRPPGRHHRRRGRCAGGRRFAVVRTRAHRTATAAAARRQPRRSLW